MLSMWLIGVSGLICRLLSVAEATVSIVIVVSSGISVEFGGGPKVIVIVSNIIVFLDGVE